MTKELHDLDYYETHDIPIEAARASGNFDVEIAVHFNPELEEARNISDAASLLAAYVSSAESDIRRYSEDTISEHRLFSIEFHFQGLMKACHASHSIMEKYEALYLDFVQYLKAFEASFYRAKKTHSLKEMNIMGHFAHTLDRITWVIYNKIGEKVVSDILAAAA